MSERRQLTDISDGVNRKRHTGRSFNRNLDTTGDGTGVDTISTDYSGVTETFLLSPGATEVFRVHQLSVYLQVGTFSTTNYGSGSAISVSGLRLTLNSDRSGFTVVNLTPNFTTNDELFEAASPNIQLVPNTGSSTRIFAWWDFPEIIRLDGAEGDRIEVIANDDFQSAYTTIMAHGYLEM